MFSSFDYLFPCKLSLPWFLCLGILDCIIRLRILIKSYGESWYFCFSRESAQLGSGYKFLFVFCELWFPYEFHVQRLYSALCTDWCGCHPVAILWPGRRFVSLITYLTKSMVWCLAWDPCVCNVEVTPRVLTQLYGFAWSSSSFFATLGIFFFSSLELPFLVLRPELWAFLYLTLLQTCHNCGHIWSQVMRGWREKKE